MSSSLYIATMEPRAGKSVLTLGITELLSRRLNKIGFFRPAIPEKERDNNIQFNEGIQFARESYESRGCTIISTIANRVLPTYLSAVNKHFKDDADTATNDLSRRATIADLINAVAIPAIRAPDCFRRRMTNQRPPSWGYEAGPSKGPEIGSAGGR